LLDIECAEEFGYEFKLLAIIREHEDQFEIRVHPTMVPKQHPLISVRGEYTAFYVNTDMIGNYMLSGKGVGIEATCSLILRDLIDIADKTFNNPRKTKYNLSWNLKSVMPISEVETSYYLRFPCMNRPGVIGEIANILGEFKINIGSAHAEVDREKGVEFGFVHIFIEKVQEKAIISALERIKDLDVVRERIKFFRILED
jgi:homoserine dehydrogenase